ERSFIIRYDERFESDRDARFAAGRGSLIEFANSGQADCKPVSIASRAWSDEMGRGSGVSRIPAGRLDLRDGGRIVHERAFSSFRWIRRLVASLACRSSTVPRSR